VLLAIADDFTVWWARFPRKVGKLAAEREYVKARKTATAAELLDGIARYLEAKPSYADVCHPKTFFSQGRWLDEVPVSRSYETWTCPHTPHCPHRAACAIVAMRT
jgi:hypothetical protein